MKLSIIIPTYNMAGKIAETINSILSQDIDDYEVIIIDDCSMDNTQEVIKQINNEHIRYFKLEKNKGVSHARNLGIKKSTGKYIVFLDSDDFQINNMSKKLLEEISKGYEMVFCSYVIKSKGKNIIKKIKNTQSDIHNLNMQSLIEILFSNNLLKSPCNKIYLSELLKRHNIMFDEKIPLGEDYRFNLDYINVIDDVSKISYIDEILYIYNRTENGLSLKKNNDRTKIKLDNWKYHKKIVSNDNIDYLYWDYIKIIVLGMLYNKNILNDTQVKAQLQEIKNESKNKKIKLINKVLLRNNYIFNKLICIMCKIIERSRI